MFLLRLGMIAKLAYLPCPHTKRLSSNFSCLFSFQNTQGVQCLFLEDWRKGGGRHFHILLLFLTLWWSWGQHWRTFSFSVLRVSFKWDPSDHVALKGRTIRSRLSLELRVLGAWVARQIGIWGSCVDQISKEEACSYSPGPRPRSIM